MLNKCLLALCLLTIFFSFDNAIWAQEMEATEEDQVLEGRIVQIQDAGEIDVAGQQANQQIIEVQVTKGFLSGSSVPVYLNSIEGFETPTYEVGDQVLITATRDADGNRIFYISDFIRRDALIWLFIIFVGTVLAVARWWGLRSLLGLAFSFLVIFWFILPQINAGRPPLLIAILGSALIMIVTYYLSHGINRKTHIALLSTLLALLITGVMTLFFTDFARLTGFASEEATFLSIMKHGSVNIRGLLLAGIIVGTLGVLDDITISQAAVVMKLKQTNPKMRSNQLFWHAMEIGHDHIASLVNTLILVYAGSAFPLLLLFINSNQSFSEVINYELVTEEIIKTLVGSIGLVLAVPITTFLAAYYGFRNSASMKDLGPRSAHHH